MATCSGIKKVPKSLIFQAFRDELLTRIELVTSTLPRNSEAISGTSPSARFGLKSRFLAPASRHNLAQHSTIFIRLLGKC